jgi:hypothetical protein
LVGFNWIPGTRRGKARLRLVTIVSPGFDPPALPAALDKTKPADRGRGPKVQELG